jgi:TonB family protein
MTKAKELTNIIIILLVLGAVFSLYLGAYHALIKTPAFICGEIVVQKTAANTITKAIPKAIPIPQAVPPAETAAPIVPPSIISRIMPEYPAAALEKGIEGVVMVQAFIGLNGKAEKVEIKVSSGDPELDASAIKAVSQWSFNPAAQAGAPVASWFEVPIRFTIK